ncbi:MAG: preprotein translocase subunit SecE [Bacteroidota bacterium]
MKIIRYFKEAFQELVYKVTWPSWPELQNSAIVVMIATLIISLIVFIMDFSFRNIMEFVYKMFY